MTLFKKNTKTEHSWLQNFEMSTLSIK